MRADARRNYERIVATARDAFLTDGVDVPLDDIAKRAGVGAGTLYRHFPSRDSLVEAVYREEITQLADAAFRLRDELPPGDALFAWMREQVRWINDSLGMASALKSAMDSESETYAYCKKTIRAAVGALLEPAQEAGIVRADLQQGDLLRLTHGVGAAAQYSDAEGVERMLTVLIDGMRAS